MRCCASSRRWRISTTSRPSTRTTTFPTRSWRPSRLRERLVSGVHGLLVLGVDPGLAATGYGLIGPGPAGVTVIDTGVVETDADLPFDARLQAVYDGVHRVLDTHGPDLLVVEDLYSEYEFPRAALLVAHARGVVFLAARQRQVRVLALAPAEVKRAITGHGAASKAQIQRGIQRLLGLDGTPRPSHVADALALAFTGFSRAGGRIG